ncbi:MAG: hypothetical protein LBQ64_02935 [Bacteroidales bacterium]|nr:hypothetical protein [Bacteroidales bacterium]
MIAPWKASVSKAIIGNDGQNVYGHSILINKLLKYNLKTMTVTSAEYKLKTPVGKMTIRFALMIRGEIYFFSLVQDKKRNMHILQVQTVDKNTMTIRPDFRRLFEISSSEELINTPVRLDVCFSPDSSKILFNYQIAQYGSTTHLFGKTTVKESQIINPGFIVLNDQLKEVWREESMKTGISSDFLICQFAVDNAGNVYVAGKTDSKEPEGKKAAKSEACIILYAEGRSPVPVSIDLPDIKYPMDIRMGFNSRSEAVCAGTYSNVDLYNVLGLFSAKINFATESPEEVFITEFDIDYFTEGLDASARNRLEQRLNEGGHFENYAYRLFDIRFLNNGTFIMDARKRYFTLINNLQREEYDSLPDFSNIMIACFNGNASLNWVKQIARGTNAGMIAALGDHALITDEQDNIHVYYNLMDYSQVMSLPVFKNTKMIQYSFNAQGENSQKEIYDAKQTGITPRPGEFSFIESSNTLFMRGNKGAYEFNFLTIPIQ